MLKVGSEWNGLGSKRHCLVHNLVFTTNECLAECTQVEIVRAWCVASDGMHDSRIGGRKERFRVVEVSSFAPF